jgi:hypothetical protein
MELLERSMSSENYVVLIAEMIEASADDPSLRKAILEQERLITKMTSIIEKQISFECEYAILKALAKLTTDKTSLYKRIWGIKNIVRIFKFYVRHPNLSVRLRVAQL